MEKLEGSCDLFDFIRLYAPFNESLCCQIIGKIIKILFTLKRAKIAHRDIKEENIIINLNNFNLKLIDFGSATFDSNKLQRPEFDNTQYGPYSMGHTVWS